MKRLTQKAMIDLVLSDLQAWADAGGDQSDDGMLYALRNGYRLHAANLWLGTGACTPEVDAQVATLKISHRAEMREVRQLCASAFIYICPDCNHHGFHDDDEGESIQCFSCNETAYLKPKTKGV